MGKAENEEIGVSALRDAETTSIDIDDLYEVETIAPGIEDIIVRRQEINSLGSSATEYKAFTEQLVEIGCADQMDIDIDNAPLHLDLCDATMMSMKRAELDFFKKTLNEESISLEKENKYVSDHIATAFENVGWSRPEADILNDLQNGLKPIRSDFIENEIKSIVGSSSTKEEITKKINNRLDEYDQALSQL
jgi:hypothetical protein